MEERSTLKLIMEKGPREGETLEYTSGSLVKIGRVVRGNTIAIKDAGISSKHICIEFDYELNEWTLSDLDSSNGTFLNGQIIEPNAPIGLNDGDCIKIGELTSMIVNIGVREERYPKRQGKSGAGAGAETTTAANRGKSGSALDVDLGKTAVEEPVEKRILRSRGKKAVDLKNEVEILGARRTRSSSKKEEKVNFIPTLKQIPENLNVDVSETTDLSAPIEPKKTRGRTKKLPVQPPENSELDELPIDGRNTRRGRKGLPLVNVQSNCMEENINNANNSVLVDEGNKATFDVFSVENVENSGLEEKLNTNNESAQDHEAEKLLLMQEGCKGKEFVIDESLQKGSSEVADVDKGKEVAEELECRQDDSKGLVKSNGTDNGRWLDLEKMTLGDFFDYLEVQLPKEIYDRSEKIIADMAEKTRKYHEFRLQRNENGKVPLPTG